ncbi:MAG: TetR/AcrR family transcriptional regulator [Clostridia bacterium]|nr:TetR/AcrR family transcriptional regulator [Clostridia bacterium]
MEERSGRDRLIEAGLEELYEYGVQGFSLRRAAQRCGLSCAAPYKHFRDKQAYLMAIAESINESWFARQSKALEALEGDTALQLRAVCREYLRFLVENQVFCSLVLRRDDDSGKWALGNLFDQSSVTKRLIARYTEEYRLSEEEAYSRTYALRAVIIGSALMRHNDEMPLNEHVLDTIFRMMDTLI